MTTLVERVAAEANRMRFWPTMLALVTGLLHAVGWAAYHVIGLVWTVGCWCVAGVKLGWREAAVAAAARREASDGDRPVR